MTEEAVGDAATAGRLDWLALDLPVAAEVRVGWVDETSAADRLSRVELQRPAHVLPALRDRRVYLLATDCDDLSVDAVMTDATVGDLATASALYRLALNLTVATHVEIGRERFAAAADVGGWIIRLAATHWLVAARRRRYRFCRCCYDDLDYFTATAHVDLKTDESRQPLNNVAIVITTDI